MQNYPAWETAWGWVLRQHEERELGEPVRAELARWLAADPRHLAVYEEACRVWLMAGFLPPVNPIEIPGVDPSDTDSQSG